MEQQILTISTLNEFASWLGRNFVIGTVKPTKARALYMFANKIGTPHLEDGNPDYSKFEDVEEAEKYLDYIGHMKFVFESKVIDTVKWFHNKGTEKEYVTYSDVYEITAVLSVASEDDNRFTVFCGRPYNNNYII